MAKYSSELETVFRKYMDSRGEKSRDKLRDLLRNESVDRRQMLLITAREVDGKMSGLHSGAAADDLETIKNMLKGFFSQQKYNVVKIQSNGKWTALHTAADRGHTSIINYLLSDLSQQQKYDLLKIQDVYGNTALHRAASNKKVEAVQAIISSVSLPLLIQLLNIKNKEGQTVTDIRPELHDELPVLTSQGIASICSVDE